MENHHYSRVMLRFRPIAPKPAAGDRAEEQEARIGAAAKSERRTKRKYVRVRGRQSAKMKPTDQESRSSPPAKSGVDDSDKSAVTLQLLPERSESENISCCYSSSAPKFQDLIDPEQYRSCDEVSYKSEAVAAAVAGATATTWIVVECVTDTCVDGLGYSDEEILKNLQADTCPGFVSDGANNVVWVNDACRRMGAESGGVVVRLVVREELPYFTPSFACRVRMVQQTKQGHQWNKIVACDVWRMEFAAAFAWKLDVETALGLGV